jgi:tRNA nucleotidyltransferase (CCA-adding enzyme)
MKVYLVGGAVRDELLGLKVQERDWVVVGATPDDLIAQGYKPVGKDFPVFLHPTTKEEYALARTERKTAHGYKGFVTDYSHTVTLEEDLLRRDLTINAIAKDSEGNFIDPYNGIQDLKNRTLKHVSQAFKEDPVRILRLARFAARFHGFGFTVDKATTKLMQIMVEEQEVNHLVSERVWKETERALKEQAPQVFFEVLKSCNALKVIFPEIDNLYGVPNPEKHHPEIDSGIHTLMVLEQAALLSASQRVRFAALVHDLGKAVTPKELWPKHYGHDKRGVKLVNNLCARLKIPNAYQKLAVKVTEFHGLCHRAFELRADTIARLLKQLDAFRNPDDFYDFLLACEADSRGRTGFENREYPQAGYLASCFAAARLIKSQPFLDEGYEGIELAKVMYEAQVMAINNIKKNQS